MSTTGNRIMKRRRKNARPSTANPRETGEEVAALVHQAMTANSIADQIFSYLPFSDLLQCSEVSKIWNYQARSYLRRKKRCLLVVSQEDDCCKNLKEAYSVIENCEQVPYSGVSIASVRTDPSIMGTTLSDYYRRVQVAEEKRMLWSRLAEALAVKVKPIKHVNLRFGGCVDLEVLVTVKGILEMASPTMESISTAGLPASESAALINSYNRPMLMLKEFHITESRRLPTETFQKILKYAPNLKKISGNITPPFLLRAGFPVPNMVDLIKELKIDVYHSVIDQCSQLAEHNLKLEALEFSSFHLQFRSVSWWNRMDEIKAMSLSLLSSSSKSMTELRIDLLDLVRLIPKELPVMENVTNLTIFVNAGVQDITWTLTKILTKISFGEYFPKLDKVVLRFDGFFNSRFYTSFVSPAFLQLRPKQKCCTVTKLVLLRDGSPLPDRYMTPGRLKQLARQFPNVREFYLEKCDNLRQTFEALKFLWPKVETISLAKVDIKSIKSNVDDVICGMKRTRATKLRRLNEELSPVHAGNSSLSFRRLTNLRTLRIEVMHAVPDRVGQILRMNPGELLISRLSGACAFSHMRGLTVEVYLVNRQRFPSLYQFSLEHLKPYVKLNSLDKSMCLKTIGL